MRLAQEKATTLALNVLQVGSFECPKHYYEYFISNDEWALMLTAAGMNAADTPPQVLALAVLRNALLREGLFHEMTDFELPAHFCSFLQEKIRTGERKMCLEPWERGNQTCRYATLEHLRESRSCTPPRHETRGRRGGLRDQRRGSNSPDPWRQKSRHESPTSRSISVFSPPGRSPVPPKCSKS